MRASIEILKADQPDLGGRLANVQQGLAVTTDQAREILEKIITDSRTALIEVRCEGLLTLQAAMRQHEESLRALHTTWTDQVRFDLLGIRTELDATQARLQQIGSATATAMGPADRLLRKDRWAATAPSVKADATGVSPPGGLAGGAGVSPSALLGLRKVRDEYLRFEVNMKMWEGPAHDRKPLEMTKDASGCASWRDRTLTVVACKYLLVRDLLLLAEREKNPIGDMTEVALAAKAGLSLLPAEVRLLSDTIFNNVKLLLHDNLAPTTQVVGVERGLELWRKLHDVGRGSSDLTNREKVKSYTYPRLRPNLDDLAVKLDLWKGLRTQLEALEEVFTERQHWMALDELVPADMLAEMQTRVELDTYVARIDFVSRRVSHHRTLAQRS